MKTLREQHAACLDLLSRITFDGKHLGDILPITYFASVLELVDSSIILLENEKIYDVYPLLRTIQEHSVDILNMSKDSGYFRCILLDHEQNWKKILQQAQSGNRFLASFKGRVDTSAQITARTAEIKKLRAEGGEFITIEERFRRAERLDEYRSVYRLQSMYAHTSLQSSISRHMIEVDEGLQFSMFEGPDPTSLETVRSGLDEFMRISRQSVEQIFDGRITRPSSAPK